MNSFRSSIPRIGFKFFLWFLILAVHGSPGFSARVPESPKILILNSYHPGEAWSDNELAGVLAVLRKSNRYLVPPIEYLDFKRHSVSEQMNSFKEYLARKYKGQKIDVLIVLDNPALDLALKYRNEIFPGVPIVFAGINDFRVEMLKGHGDITGVAQTDDIEGTMRLALSLHPKTKRILVVRDHTSSGRAMEEETKAVAPAFSGKVEILYPPEEPFPDLKRRIETLPADSLVLLLTYVADSTRHVFSREESTRLITEASRVPVYSIHEALLGFGIVGGSLLDGEDHGAQAAEMVLRILAGEPASSIPMENSRSTANFDYPALTRFRIDEGSLPKGSIIANRPVSFYEQNRTLVIGVSAFLALLLVAVVGLSVAFIRTKRAEEALRESGERYRELFENANDIIFTYDLAGNFTSINKMAQETIGYTRDEALKINISSVLAPEYVDVVRHMMSREDTERGLTQYELEIVCKNGRRVSVEVNTRIIYKRGKAFGVQGIARDITERKCAEEDLKESKALIDTVVDNIPLMIFLKEATDLRFVLFNRAGEELLGYDRKELLGKSDLDFFPPEQAAHFMANDREIIDGELGILDIPEESITTARKGLRLLHTRKVCIRGGDGATKYLLGISEDITERKRAEEALQKSEDALRLFVEHAPAAIAMFDRDMKYMAASRRFLTDYNLGDQDVIGRSHYEVFPEISERWKNIHRRCLAGAVEKAEEDPFPRSDGTTDWVRWEIHPWYEALDKIGGIILFSEVITERKQAEAEKEKLQSQLQQSQKMEVVGRLAGGVAHDFNNLLTVITGYSELLLQKVGKESPMHGQVEEIRRAGEHAASLTKQLLAFSRKQIIEPKVLDLNLLTADLGKMLIRLIGENIDLKTVPGKNLGLVKVDPGQFEQVLINLAVNARDAIPDSGMLLIETANVELDEEYCAQRPYQIRPGRYVMLAVSDTGHGMTEETSKQIFEPFFTTKATGKGTGLGLSMVYGAVKQSGGSIEAYSEVGKGTTFKIYLPRVEGDIVIPAKDDRPMVLPSGAETVLVVEDEDTLRILCERILGDLGYKAMQARNGTEAIAMAQKYGDRIDLLLTDVVMPGMNGRELANQLTRIHPETRVLFTSGYTDDAIVHHGVLDEGVSFISKPYTPSALARKIREVLDKA